MPRAQNKADLLKAAAENYKKLQDFIAGMSQKELETPFDFSSLNKSESHWARDKNLRDVLIHLYEWHNLLFKAIERNEKTPGIKFSFLPEDYNWKTYPAMNVKFWQSHQATSLEEAKKLLEDSHKKTVSLIEKFSDEELFTKGHFAWTGTTNLGAYFISAAPSHYDWALKKLKVHKKLVENGAI